MKLKRYHNARRLCESNLTVKFSFGASGAKKSIGEIVINFGFSAFLRMVSMNDRPQKTEIRNRLVGRGQSGGYDFHASLKRLCKQITAGHATLAQALEQTSAIAKSPERMSAKAGLENYANWRLENSAESKEFDHIVYTSPMEKFSVKFIPDFYQVVNGKMTAGHIWNTASPALSERQAFFSLFLIRNAYLDEELFPQDLAILDLKKNKTVALSNAVGFSTAAIDGFVSRLERVFEVVESEIEVEEVRSPAHQTIFPPV